MSREEKIVMLKRQIDIIYQSMGRIMDTAAAEYQRLGRVRTKRRKELEELEAENE